MSCISKFSYLDASNNLQSNHFMRIKSLTYELDSVCLNSNIWLIVSKPEDSYNISTSLKSYF